MGEKCKTWFHILHFYSFFGISFWRDKTDLHFLFEKGDIVADVEMDAVFVFVGADVAAVDALLLLLLLLLVFLLPVFGDIVSVAF